MTTLKKTLVALALAGLAGQALAASVIDTGVPDGAGLPYAVDDNDWLAAKIVLDGTTSTITDVRWYLAAANPGDSFTVALYGDGSSGPSVANELFATTASYTAAGWNGLSNLNWQAGTGTFWVALESRGQGIVAEAPTAAAVSPIASAFYDGVRYTVSTPMTFGLQVTAVPEPSDWLMMIAGLAFVGAAAARRRTDRSVGGLRAMV